MRRFSPEEKADQNFRQVLQQISTEPNTIRHRCTKCRLGLPSMECLDCFALLCQGCIRLQGHDPTHKVVFHHPENLPQNALPGQPLNKVPPDMSFTGIYGFEPLKREFIEGLGEQPIRRCPSISREPDSDDRSVVDVQDLKRSIARDFKAVKTTANAKALFEKSVKVCHTCDFEIFEPDHATDHNGHHVTDPDEAAEAIKDLFRSLEKNGPILVQRGEEAQHLCILERARVKKLNAQSQSIIREAYTLGVNALAEFEKEFTKTLGIGIDQRMAEMEVIDAVLYHQIQIEDRYDRWLKEILEVGEVNPGLGVNMWRDYCTAVRRGESEKLLGGGRPMPKHNLVVPGGIFFCQLGEYIENVTLSVKKMKLQFNSLIDEMGRLVADHIDRTELKADKLMDRLTDDLDLCENDILSLRDSLRLQTLTGMPVQARSGGGGGNTEPTIYSQNIGPITMSSFFYMVDTFHTKWIKVLVTIHSEQWLAIYVPDNPHVIDSDDPLRGFRAGEFAELVDETEDESFRNPPESILNLAELQVNLLTKEGGGGGGGGSQPLPATGSKPPPPPPPGKEALPPPAGKEAPPSGKMSAAAPPPPPSGKESTPPPSAKASDPPPPAPAMSPVGKLLSEVVMIPAFEILRVIKGRVQGWWVFVHPEAEVVEKWEAAISTWGSNSPGRQDRWPSRSSTMVPSTNPGTTAASLGLAFAPVGRRWGAVHVREAPRRWGADPRDDMKDSSDDDG